MYFRMLYRSRIDSDMIYERNAMLRPCLDIYTHTPPPKSIIFVVFVHKNSIFSETPKFKWCETYQRQIFFRQVVPFWNANDVSFSCTKCFGLHIVLYMSTKKNVLHPPFFLRNHKFFCVS